MRSTRSSLGKKEEEHPVEMTTKGKSEITQKTFEDSLVDKNQEIEALETNKEELMRQATKVEALQIDYEKLCTKYKKNKKTICNLETNILELTTEVEIVSRKKAKIESLKYANKILFNQKKSLYRSMQEQKEAFILLSLKRLQDGISYSSSRPGYCNDQDDEYISPRKSKYDDKRDLCHGTKPYEKN